MNDETIELVASCCFLPLILFCFFIYAGYEWIERMSFGLLKNPMKDE